MSEKKYDLVPNSNINLEIASLMEHHDESGEVRYELYYEKIIAFAIEDCLAKEPHELFFFPPIPIGIQSGSEDNPVIFDRVSWHWFDMAYSGDGIETLLKYLVEIKSPI